jgi:ABC-type polysaccharide/polyol phosphate export permease
MQLATNEAPSHFRSSAARPGGLSLFVTAMREIASRRRLIRYLVRAEVKRQGTDTLLGNLWWLLDPLISMLIYVVVMTFIFQRATVDFPLFLLSAMIPFKWLTGTITSATKSITGKESLIKQIQFPKIVLPLEAIGAEMVNFIAGLGLLAVLLILVYPAHASLELLWLPVLIAIQLIFVSSLAIALAAITVFYRDVGNLMGHVTRLIFYVAPILWSFDDVAGRGSALEKGLGHTGFVILRNNPVSVLLESYRHVIYGVSTGSGYTPPTSPELMQLAALTVFSLVLLFGAVVMFKRVEPAFAKVL